MKKTNSNNQVWKLDTGFLGAYTEDRSLMQRVRRYKLKNGWEEMARYYKNDRLIGVHYKLPIEQRRVALRMFEVTDLSD